MGDEIGLRRAIETARNSQMNSISIDPGKNGSLTFWNNLTVTYIQDIPYKTYKTIGAIPDYKQLAEIFSDIDLVIIENIGASPTDGIASASKFTKEFGIIVGASAVAKRTEFVRPSVWKSGVGIVNKPKKAAVPKALSLHPEAEDFLIGQKNIVDRADSLLLGHFWLKIKEKI